MIKGFFENNNIFSEMENSFYTFHLTGSYYFGKVKPNSDYDFFANYSSEIVSFLESLGFYKKSFSTYSDNNTVCVMHCNGEFSIDVQLVHDALHKLKIQKVINEHFKNIYNNLTKEQRKDFWNSMYSICDLNII